MNATLNIIAGDKKQDDFIHRVDMFEPFKRLGHCFSVTYEIPDGTSRSDIVAVAKELLTRSGSFVTAVWDAQHSEHCYVDWNVKVVSDGQKWFMLRDYLAQFGIHEPVAV